MYLFCVCWFSSLAHLSVFLHYLVSNEDPKYLVSVKCVCVCVCVCVWVWLCVQLFIIIFYAVFLSGCSKLSEYLSRLWSPTASTGNSLDILHAQFCECTLNCDCNVLLILFLFSHCSLIWMSQYSRESVSIPSMCLAYLSLSLSVECLQSEDTTDMKVRSVFVEARQGSVLLLCSRLIVRLLVVQRCGG